MPINLSELCSVKYNTMKEKVLTLVLLALWLPVSIDKLLQFEGFKAGILRQPFSNELGTMLVYFLPPMEILTVILLLLPAVRDYGFLLSSVLMGGFTVYIGIALVGAWEKLPCGCGSVISGLSWKQHFFFNLFFLLTSIYGLNIQNLQRGGAAGCEAAEGGPA